MAHRALYFVGFGYLAVCGVVVLRHYSHRGGATQPAATPTRFDGSAEQWFAAIKASCNEVEVELAQRQHPAPPSLDGQGFSAACFALGGKLDSARAIIDRLPQGRRYQAAGIVFNVAHPVADAGDDRSAGPIMELVLDYWPNHYMALYHAGMSEYALGQPALARTHLESFLTYYHQNDGWTRNARDVLARLQ
jgi:hypothetical protein